MPRNGSGTYTMPSNGFNPAVSGQSITASDWNTTKADIETALSGSIAKDGQTVATARVPFAAGTSAFLGAVAGVSYSFSSDPNTGVYSPAADKGGLVAGGVEIVRWESGLFSPVLTNTIDLGTSSLKYKNGYFAGNLTVGTVVAGAWNGTIITSAYGGTGNGFTKFTGPTTSERTFTLPDASATLVTTGSAYTFTRGQAIEGSSDEIQLRVKANASQTAKTFVVEQVGGGDIFTVDPPSGAVAVTGALNVTGYQDGFQFRLKGTAGQATAVMLVEKSDGTDLFSIDKDGNIISAGTVTANGTVLGAGAMVLLGTGTASASATLDFTSLITSTYSTYIFELDDIVPATDGVNLWIRTSTDNTNFDAGASDYSWTRNAFSIESASPSISSTGDNADAQMIVAAGVGNAAAEGLSGRIVLRSPLGTARNKQLTWEITIQNTSTAGSMNIGGGQRLATTDIDAIRFLFSSGNIASGKIRMYGMKAA